MPLPSKAAVHRVVFGTDTAAGRLFDEVVIAAILLSVLVAIIDSALVHPHWNHFFHVLEWGFTVVFTVEYLLRLWCSPQPLRYVRSFYGIIDLVAILPAYLAYFFSGANMLLVMRLVRVLRVFRLLKLLAYVEEANILVQSLYASRRKVFVFLCTVFVLAVMFGSLLYVVEGPEHGFTSIPRGIYWAASTITTVGYGDMTPKTPLGQAIATLVMLVGYSVLAVPTGIITSELLQQMQQKERRHVNRHCPGCDASDHEVDAKFCRHCGTVLDADAARPLPGLSLDDSAAAPAAPVAEAAAAPDKA